MAKILVIEDDPAGRKFVCQLLRHRDHDVFEAADGGEGFALAERERPDLIFSDIILPTMDGYEIARRIRAHPDLARTPLIFYTASYRGAEAMLLAESCGVARFLEKPAESEEILAVIDDVLGTTATATLPPYADFDQAHIRVLTNKLATHSRELNLTSERLDALLKLTIRLMSAADPTDVFATLCRDGRALIASRYAFVGVLEEGRGDRMRVRMASGLTPDLEHHAAPPFAPSGIVGRAFREQRPIRLAGSALRKESTGLPDMLAPSTSMLVAPIRSSSQTYGWACFTDRIELDAFTAGDEEVARVLGYTAGVVYENQLRLDRLERSKRRLNVLHEIDVAILAAHSPEQIAEASAERLRELVSAARVEILEFDDDCTVACRLASAPPRAAGAADPRSFPVALLGRIDRLLADLRGGALHLEEAPDAPVDERYRWLVPLVSQGTLVGTLRLDVADPQAFGGESRDVAIAIAAQTAIAIQNARQRRQIAEAENKYRSLYDGAPLGIFRSTPEGRILAANPALVQMLGYPDEASLKEIPAHELYADAARRAELVTIVERDGVVQGFEVEHRRRDGGTLWSATSARAMRDEARRILHYDGTVEDISERKRANEAQRERTRLARFAAAVGNALTTLEKPAEMLRRCTDIMVEELDAAFARIWTLDETGEVLELQASSGCYRHLDGPHARVPVGRFKIGLIASERRPHLTNAVIGDPRVSDPEWAKREGMVAFAGYPLMVENRLLGVIAMFAKRPLSETTLDALGSVSQAIALAIENRRAAEALRVALHRAEESDRLKTAFIANVNHEIRTPLNVIVGFVDVLRSELPAGDLQALQPIFQAIERASWRMIRTVHSMLEVARLESATVEFRPASVDLVSMVEKQAKNFRAAALEKGLILRMEIIEPDATIRFDPFCLERSLDQLIDNAVKFTSKGNITVRVRRDSDGDLCIDVEDTGTGIDGDYLPRLFDTFSQQDVSRTRRFDGLGLGLAMAKRFLALGGATIRATSTPGAGTTFSIHFDRALEIPKPSLEVPQAQEREPSPGPPIVLIVEDDPSSTLLLRKLLEGRYRVVTASSATEARERFAMEGADIAATLMDVSLGGTEDGLSLTRFVRQSPSLRHMRVIATTAHALPEDRARCLAAGCDAYLSKPFHREDLLALLAQLVGHPTLQPRQLAAQD